MNLVVLLDTTVLRYWYEGGPVWLASFNDAVAQMMGDNSVIFKASTVSWQEFLVYALGLEAVEARRAQAWLEAKAPTPINLTQEIAQLAAKLQILARVPAGVRSSARRAANNIWFRDAAIMATAVHIAADCLVYADADFNKWGSEFKGKLVHLAAPKPRADNDS